MTARSSARGTASPDLPAKAISSRGTTWTTPNWPNCSCGTKKNSSAAPRAHRSDARVTSAGCAIWRSAWVMRRRVFRCWKRLKARRELPVGTGPRTRRMGPETTRTPVAAAEGCVRLRKQSPFLKASPAASIRSLLAAATGTVSGFVVIDELRHFPVETDRQQAQQEAAEQGDQDRLFTG